MTTTTIQLQTITLKVGLHCDGCEKRVKKALWRVKGITSVDVDTKHERVIVTGFVDPAKVLKAVKKTGKSVEICKYQQSNSNNTNIFVVPTKFGDDVTGATTRVTTASTKKHGQFQEATNGNGGKYNVQDQFHGATTGGKYTTTTTAGGGATQDRSVHPQADYYLYDVDNEYGSSYTTTNAKTKQSNGNKQKGKPGNQKETKVSSFKEHGNTGFNGSTFKEHGNTFKEHGTTFKEHGNTGFKNHKLDSPEFESEDDLWPTESDDDNDFSSSYGNQKASFHTNYDNAKSSPHPNYGGNHQQQPQQQPQKSSLKSSNGNGTGYGGNHKSNGNGYGSNQKSMEPDYSKSPHSHGYTDGKSHYTNGNGSVYGSSNSDNKSQSKAQHYPGTGSLYSSSNEHKSHSKTPYSGYSSNTEHKSGYLSGNEHKSGYPSGNEHKSGYNDHKPGYTSNTEKSHNKAGYSGSYHENKSSDSYGNEGKQQQQQKKQPKSGAEQKFVTFDDEYEHHDHHHHQQQQQQQPKYRPQPQVKQRSGNPDDYTYEQRFYTVNGGHDQTFRPTYSFTYHEPSYRLPPANGGFATMFSEENPNACSIM